MKINTRYSGTVAIFLLASLVALLLFYNLATQRRVNFIENCRYSFKMTVETLARSVSIHYFRRDDFFSELRAGNRTNIEEYVKKISDDSIYIKKVQLKDTGLDIKGPYTISGDNGSIFIRFKIFNSDGTEFINNMHGLLVIDAGLLLLELQRDELLILEKSDEKGMDFIYNLRVYFLGSLLHFFHWVSVLSIGLLAALIFNEIMTRHYHYFYEIRGLQKIVFLFEKTERFSANHSVRVAAISKALGKLAGIKHRRLKDLYIAALLHDIGKISIPVEILNNPGKLSRDEFGAIKLHPIHSVRILENFEELHHIIPFVRSHHERLDGSGYPDGLTAEKIPLESRIIAIADVLEALTGERPYRKPMNIEEAVKVMRGMSLDQDILYILCDNIGYFKKVREKVIIDM